MFKKRVKSLTENQFLRNNAVFFVGSMAVAFINYLYYPIVGRLLPNAAFGELQVIISSFLQLGIILSVLSMVSINIYVNGHENKKSRATVAELEKVSLYVGIGLLVIIALLSGPLASALKFTSPLPFIAIAVAFVIGIPGAFRNAYLQAHKEFKSSSIVSLLGATSKLFFSAILVLAALQTFGAVLGIAISQIVSLLYSHRRAVKNGFLVPDKSATKRKPQWNLIKPEIPFAAFVLVMSLLTTLQISIDVTLIKYFLPSEVAGNYAAIATVARIIYFLTGSIMAVMMSSLGPSKSTSENVGMLLRSGGLIVGLGGATTLFFCIFPVFTIHLLFGSRYDSLAHILPLLSIAVFIGSLLNLMTNYLMALRKYFAVIFVVLGSLTSVCFVILNTKTIEHIVTGLLIGSATGLVGLTAFTIYISRDIMNKGNREQGLLSFLKKEKVR